MDGNTALEPPPLFDRLRGALLEDLMSAGDVTSQALVHEQKSAQADFLAKSGGVLCGVKLLPLIFQMAEQLVSTEAAGRAWDLDDAQAAAAAGKLSWDDALRLREKAERQGISVQLLRKDGDRLAKGDVCATVSGNARAILAGERTALNLLSHLSGIATYTARCVAKIAHTKAKVLDTRKTMPLWRDLQKYAVKCGGGENHRKGLYDEILIKDNHLALWGVRDPAGAVRAARARFSDLRIEVEVTDLEGLKQVVLNSQPDYILLDNFPVEALKEAVHWCEKHFQNSQNPHMRPTLEASGGITSETLAAVAETGVDRISLGALTHTISPMDFSLEMRFDEKVFGKKFQRNA
ncbi:MAG TPA: carboxylating nicotinate-nucleotide diphosphorylase [Planctomycetota bacterium]|nr:carboxylating nicotinate-nucleotide diphosphorylase [Planctomycetota bacterium]